MLIMRQTPYLEFTAIYTAIPTIMFQALKPALEQDKIPDLNSATIASPNDPRKYLRDSHFTVNVDNELARALTKIIDEASGLGSIRNAYCFDLKPFRRSKCLDRESGADYMR